MRSCEVAKRERKSFPLQVHKGDAFRQLVGQLACGRRERRDELGLHFSVVHVPSVLSELTAAWRGRRVASSAYDLSHFQPSAASPTGPGQLCGRWLYAALG